MKPLQPDLSFLAQKYLNHAELWLTRFVNHFHKRAKADTHSSGEVFYETLAKSLAAFQKDVPVIERCVFQLSEVSSDYFRILSTYRHTEGVEPAVLATIELDRAPRASFSKTSALGPVTILQYMRDTHPHLSLACLLTPIQNLADGLLKAGWYVTSYADAQEKHILTLTDGTFVVYVIINLDEFEADTAAIKEFHANREKKDG